MGSSDPVVLAGATIVQQGTALLLFYASKRFFDPAKQSPGVDWSKVGPYGGDQAKGIIFKAGGGAAGEAAWEAHNSAKGDAANAKRYRHTIDEE
jgi:hypothetical protein